MKRILLLSLLATSGFSQTGEWIYYNKDGDTHNSVYRIKPDGTENELIMDNAGISDISEDGLKILFLDNNGIILLVNSESMDTLIVENGGINARFTYDENVIIYYKYMIGNPDGDQIYKYSFLDSSETLIADSCHRFIQNGIVSPDKQQFIFIQTNQDSMDLVIADIQSGHTSTLVTVPNMSMPYVPIFHSYWGSDDYIYLNLPDINNVIQLFRIHSANGDASLIQLTEENENCLLLESSDIHLEKLAFTGSNQETGPTGEYWYYDLESNETSYLGTIDSSSWAAHQTWSNDNSKIAIGGVWETGIWTPGSIKIFDTVTDSLTTLVDSTWPPCFWVGEPDVSVVEEADILPGEFAFHPPYPNPFNPTTTIRFDIGVGTANMQSLRIFDLTGRVVDVLMNGEINPGQHEIHWNASNQASGIYFVELVAGNFRQVQKMVLMK